MEKRKSLIIIPIVSALVLAIAIGVMAFSPGVASSPVFDIQAQDGDDTSDSYPWGAEFGGMHGHGRMGRFGMGTSFDYDAFMADALGVTVDEFQAARLAARDAALDQAVEEGIITADYADLLKARHALSQYIDHQAILSEALGLDEAELEAALQDGKSIPYLMGELGLEPEDVQAAMQNAYQDAVQQAVDDGVITDSQAEQLQDSGFGSRGLGMRGFGSHGRGAGFFGQRMGSIPDNDL
jgi:ribosomal protein S20